jgi:hypothetical protein
LIAVPTFIILISKCYMFVVLLEIALLGTKASYGYLAKVFQLHARVHVDVLYLFLTLCLCTFHVCVHVLVCVLVHVLAPVLVYVRAK